jgi:hypothetical protein
VLIPRESHLDSAVVFVENSFRIECTVDEKDANVEVILSEKFGTVPPLVCFEANGEWPSMDDSVRFRTDTASSRLSSPQTRPVLSSTVI